MPAFEFDRLLRVVTHYFWIVSGLFSICFRFVFDLFSICIRFVFDLFSICIRGIFQSFLFITSDRSKTSGPTLSVKIFLSRFYGSFYPI